MRDDLFAVHIAIHASDGIGKARAGGGKRLEAEACQHARGTGIPGIGDDEGAVAPVQIPKGFRLL